MPKYSRTSKANLSGAHRDLQAVFKEIIKFYDCSILFGYRSPAEQFKIWQNGRTIRGGRYVKIGPVSTYCDGYKRPSKHNARPSDAIDARPYPYPRNAEKRDREFWYFAGVFMATAEAMRKAGKIRSRFEWGGRWRKLYDPFHFQRAVKK